jgi:hypothetical protein
MFALQIENISTTKVRNSDEEYDSASIIIHFSYVQVGTTILVWPYPVSRKHFNRIIIILLCCRGSFRELLLNELEAESAKQI